MSCDKCGGFVVEVTEQGEDGEYLDCLKCLNCSKRTYCAIVGKQIEVRKGEYFSQRP